MLPLLSRIVLSVAADHELALLSSFVAAIGVQLSFSVCRLDARLFYCGGAFKLTKAALLPQKFYNQVCTRAHAASFHAAVRAIAKDLCAREPRNLI